MKNKFADLIIIGAGAAGLIASISAALNGKKVIIFEKNKIPGKKLLITGKGRCNITNYSNTNEIMKNVLGNSKFLFSSFNDFSAYDIIDFFNNIGLKTKIERGNRVFPISDRSQDVVNILENHALKLGVLFEYDSEIKKENILIENREYKGIIHNSTKYLSRSLLISTGGMSYPKTGSTGDGYVIAKSMGHKIETLLPGLSALETKEKNVKNLMGLTLKNVNVKLNYNNKNIYQEFGELLFTHFGLSGPTILSISSYAAKEINEGNAKIVIDLKPALDYNKLENRILRDFKENINKDFINSLNNLLPKKMIPFIVELTNIDSNKKVNSITKEERKNLVNILKNLSFEILKVRPIEEAIITKGGINLDEIESSTLESKLVKGVYFAGEILDLDGLTGGYNLTIAFSTGYKVGMMS